jgi:hypothetical protein
MNDCGTCKYCYRPNIYIKDPAIVGGRSNLVLKCGIPAYGEGNLEEREPVDISKKVNEE